MSCATEECANAVTSLWSPDSHLRRCQLQNSLGCFISQSCSNIQPRDNRSYEINWMSDQDMQAAQSKFCCGACRGLEMRATPSGMLYSYVCQHFCLWTLTFFQHASFAFVLIISFSHLASLESKKYTGTPHSFLLPLRLSRINRPFNQKPQHNADHKNLQSCLISTESSWSWSLTS